jgi:PAS domain S-box-containing protein
MNTAVGQQLHRSPDDSGVAALARAVTASHELVIREPQETIAALKAQALRYQTASDNVSVGVCFFDKHKRLILCNRRYAEVCRLSIEQVSPATSLREIAECRFASGSCPTTADEYLTWCGAINANAAPQTWTTSLKDGRTIQIHHQPMPDGGWVSTHEDITELQTSRSVAHERISLQTLIDRVPDYLWVKDAESRFVVVNRALADDSGRARTSDMIGLTDFDLHAPEAAQHFRACKQQILTSGQPMIDAEEAVINAFGLTKWLLTTKVPLRSDQNEIFGLVGIARDITRRKLADLLRDGQARILEMIATNAPLMEVLDRLVRLVESVTGAKARANLGQR